VIEFVRSRRIDAPPDRVWPLVDDVTRWPEWFTEAERAEVLSGAGVGRRQRMFGRNRGGKPTEIDSVVVASEPPRLLRWHHEAERVDGNPGSVILALDATAEVTIAPDGDGSLVTYRSPGRAGIDQEQPDPALPRARPDRRVVRDIARPPRGGRGGSPRRLVPIRRIGGRSGS
jgi:uncharacterized protein YndB with AHSA1/START domain